MIDELRTHLEAVAGGRRFDIYREDAFLFVAQTDDGTPIAEVLHPVAVFDGFNDAGRRSYVLHVVFPQLTQVCDGAWGPVAFARIKE